MVPNDWKVKILFYLYIANLYFISQFTCFNLYRAFVYLNNLVHNVPLVHKVVIVNERAEVKGHLRVAIEPVTDGMFYQSLRIIVTKESFLSFSIE